MRSRRAEAGDEGKEPIEEGIAGAKVQEKPVEESEEGGWGLLPMYQFQGEGFEPVI